METKHGAVKVGSAVQVRDLGGSLVWVRVENLEADIKNGRPGFDGHDIKVAFVNGEPVQVQGRARWAYLSQIEYVR